MSKWNTFLSFLSVLPFGEKRDQVEILRDENRQIDEEFDKEEVKNNSPKKIRSQRRKKSLQENALRLLKHIKIDKHVSVRFFHKENNRAVIDTTESTFWEEKPRPKPRPKRLLKDQG
jgi:hypothetical protein